MERMTIEATSKENDYSKHITKAGTWELLINYFKQHYRNEHKAVVNLKRPLLPIVTVGENGL